MSRALFPSVIACALAALAMAVSLLHAGPPGRAGIQGPRGLAGPAGSAGKSAQTARLGICWSVAYQDSGGVSWVGGVSIDQPVLASGVYTCPQGDTFTSIVPAVQATS